MKTLKYIALAALICSFAACTQDEDFIPQGDADAVKITASIGKLQTRVSYDERNTTFDEGDQIKVENKLRTSKNVATYTLTDEEWNTADPFVWNGASKNEFEAWYPLTASYTTFTIPTDQSSEQLLGAADWMTASSGEIDKPENQTLNLDFQHQLSKVTVTIADWNDEFGGTAQEVSTPKIYSKGTDIEVVYATDGPNVTTSDGALTAITPSAVGHTYTAIVAPAKYATTDKFMTFTVNGQEMTVLATPPSLNEEGLQAGLHYLFNLKVGKDAVTLYSVKVTPWSETEIDGGVAEEIPPYTYNESTNTYTVLTADALSTAISNAKTSGTTENPAIIKLAANVEIVGTMDENDGVTRGIDVDKGVITLDLNGYTIKLTDDSNNLAIMVDNGATLTIDDSSEGKQGKITNAETVLYPYNGKLTINGGTFEGEFAVWGFENESVIEINGGTFIATYDAIYAQRSNLTITGGTFNGDRYALCLISGGSVSITGGSFSGKEYDIDTFGEVGFLSYNQETGTGPTFPGGLSIYTTESLGFNLNALLVEGAAYYDADGAKIELDASAASYDGDITVKKLTE